MYFDPNLAHKDVPKLIAAVRELAAVRPVDFFNNTLDCLISPTPNPFAPEDRHEDTIAYRHIVWWLLRTGGWSLDRIAKKTMGLDGGHSTIRHACSKFIEYDALPQQRTLSSYRMFCELLTSVLENRQAVCHLPNDETINDIDELMRKKFSHEAYMRPVWASRAMQGLVGERFIPSDVIFFFVRCNTKSLQFDIKIGVVDNASLINTQTLLIFDLQEHFKAYPRPEDACAWTQVEAVENCLQRIRYAQDCLEDKLRELNLKEIPGE